MLVIREFEESLEALTATGKIPGSVHQASGQEAVAVGVMRALERRATSSRARIGRTTTRSPRG